MMKIKPRTSMKTEKIKMKTKIKINNEDEDDDIGHEDGDDDHSNDGDSAYNCCETWTLTLREEDRLRVFENKVLMKIFGAKRDEVTGEWRKLHNTELHPLHSSPDIIRNIKSRRLRWAGHVASMGESRNAYRVSVGRPEGKRPLGRLRRRWEDNIKMDLREVGYDDREWINLAQDRDQWRAYVRAAMNLRFLKSQTIANQRSGWRCTRPQLPFHHENTNCTSHVCTTDGAECYGSPGTPKASCVQEDNSIQDHMLTADTCGDFYSPQRIFRQDQTMCYNEIKEKHGRVYGCETWTLTLREEHRLRVFENKVLRKIFGAKRDEVTGEWRKLHNAELHALYSSPDIIRNIKSRRLRWAGHVARMGESRNAYRVLVGRPEGKRPLGRPRRRWENNIKMDLREVGYDDRDWINLAQDRDRWRAYVRAAMNLRKHRLRVFENKVLRKIFGAKRDEVTGEWRKLHNTELHALYSSPDIIRNIKSRRLRWAGHVARMDESRNAYRVLVGRPEGKRSLGRPRRRWEDNIKMDLREVGYDDREWINLAQDRDQWLAYVRAAMNLRVP
ncbi:hypothetical protein ANN_20278 [Periplaneta americana]|uniref:Uncharacterized protein n=1 Tax=Periplaneta americana TaxID=6978 RepID=A0ABQ8SDG3_PERAM|nr:hypothetical protein ANN_20278 [Periplaneta americana]